MSSSSTARTPQGLYEHHLSSLTGGHVPDLVRSESPEVVAYRYAGVPDASMQAVFSYGVSLSEQAVWTHGRPELSLALRSLVPDWAATVAELAERLRTTCPFSYGTTIDWGRPLSSDTGLDAWLCFSPAVLTRGTARVDVGRDLPVNIQGVYPIYASEIDIMRREGLATFWRRDWDPYDPDRAPIDAH